MIASPGHNNYRGSVYDIADATGTLVYDENRDLHGAFEPLSLSAFEPMVFRLVSAIRRGYLGLRFCPYIVERIECNYFFVSEHHNGIKEVQLYVWRNPLARLFFFGTRI